MQPTPRTAAWSAWAGWAAVPRDLLERRRVRLTVHELADARELADLRRLDWTRLPPHQMALYTPQQIRHLIRLETALGRWPPTTAPDRWRDRRPDADARWRVHDFIQNVRLERPLETDLGTGRGAVTGLQRPPRTGGWEGAARGWAAGAVLLAVLVLLVRALERCLHRRLFKGRRSSEEWPTPNVLATSHRFGNDMGSLPRLDDSDSFPSESRDSPGIDLPPPYSECANNEEAIGSPDDDKPIGLEEPPPPYSACYFSNPKDGIPTVHFYSRGEEFGQSSSDSPPPIISNVIISDADATLDITSSQICEDDDKISEVGCEVNPSLENIVNNDQVAVGCGDNVVQEPNSGTRQEVRIRRRNEDTDHVVEMVEPEVVSQNRVIAV